MSRTIFHPDATVEVLTITPGTFRGSPVEAAEVATNEAERAHTLAGECIRRGDISPTFERARGWYEAADRWEERARTYVQDARDILALVTTKPEEG